MIVSHGHFDHYGGLIGFLRQYRSALPADVKLYAGGEDNFCHAIGRSPASLPNLARSIAASWLRTRSQSFWRKTRRLSPTTLSRRVRSRGRASKECCRTRTSNSP